MGDFGLARNIQQAEETRTARVVGTSGYIPPEYYRGVITTKMDAFGFGVVSVCVFVCVCVCTRMSVHACTHAYMHIMCESQY